MEIAFRRLSLYPRAFQGRTFLCAFRIFAMAVGTAIDKNSASCRDGFWLFVKRIHPLVVSRRDIFQPAAVGNSEYKCG